MKPIEPGCLVMLTKGPQAGKIMTTVRLVADDGYYLTIPGEDILSRVGHGRIWEVEEPMRWVCNGKIYELPYAPEFALIRIDGYDEEQHNDKQHDLERPVSGALRRTSYAD